MAHSIGKTIAGLRKKNGWTQIELADKLQVSDKAVSKWEQDSGAPSLDYFPLLAKIFDVSIDYLMTGKTPEAKIIAMSKWELCAKKDDVEMLDEILKNISIGAKDENGKRLSDYVLQYESVNLYNTGKVRGLKTIDNIKMALIANNISRLKDLNIKFSGLTDDKYIESHLRYSNAIITEEILNLVLTDERITKKTFDYLINADKEEGVWYLVMPYLIDIAYKKGLTDKFNRLLTASEKNNQYVRDTMLSKNVYDSYWGWTYETRNYFVYRNGYESFGREKEGRGLVRILEETVKSALEKSDLKNIDRFSKINADIGAYQPTEYELKMARLKADKTVSKKEINIQSTLYDGIVNIDKLIAFKDYKLAKEVLEKYPIHSMETVYSLYVKKEYDKLAENNDGFSDFIRKGRFEELESRLLQNWKKGKMNEQHFYIYKNERKVDIFNSYYYQYDPTKEERPDPILIRWEKLQECKRRILYELSLRLDKETMVGDLTKDYFEKEMKKDNTEIVIVKLCKLLEGVLKCDYHYEGDLEKMVSKYCSEQLTWYSGDEDDSWECDQATIDALNKLIANQSKIIHPEKNDVVLTREDMRYCIDYICNLSLKNV